MLCCDDLWLEFEQVWWLLVCCEYNIGWLGVVCFGYCLVLIVVWVLLVLVIFLWIGGFGDSCGFDLLRVGVLGIVGFWLV